MDALHERMQADIAEAADAIERVALGRAPCICPTCERPVPKRHRLRRKLLFSGADALRRKTKGAPFRSSSLLSLAIYKLIDDGRLIQNDRDGSLSLPSEEA